MSGDADNEFWFYDEVETVGLCRTCAHARLITSARGSTFYLCRLSETDPRFAKYPMLPVIRCLGFAERLDTDED
jgi:hypothetical protein